VATAAAMASSTLLGQAGEDQEETMAMEGLDVVGE
jgi:hypothetical protein